MIQKPSRTLSTKHESEDVVVKLIEDVKARGHRAYRHVNLDRVRGKAKKLPADGVPPEIVRLLPHDDDLDKIQVQKAATPVAGRSDLDGAAQSLSESRPNAVVLEKSTDDAADINAQRIASVRQFAQRLSKSEGSRDTKETAKTTPAAQSSKRFKSGCPAVVDTQATADDAPSAPSKDAEPDLAVQRLQVVTGNSMIDQFQP